MQSIKLSVTLQAPLAAKYTAAAMDRIGNAVAAWAQADAARGILLHHVALDVAADLAPWGLSPLAAGATAEEVKRKIDALWKQLEPDYLVLFGGPDVVPMFEVPNPSFSATGDDDTIVPTDNPYACSKAFVPGDIESYLVPDRVVGRIPDMPGDGDSRWLLASLATATRHQPRPAAYYGALYAIGCKEWREAGRELVRYLGHADSELLVSPTVTDGTASARQALRRKLHAIKCHGVQLDSHFYGQAGEAYPVALKSETLRTVSLRDTLAAAVCCYGAQVYDPQDPAGFQPGEWPIAATYLRRGGLGFMGSTMIAWVGPETMMCADWIVAQYLKSACGGASLGRSLLEAKQHFLRWLTQQGRSPDIADQKTLIEFVLLGDPSLHPVAQSGGGGGGAVPASGTVAAAAKVARIAAAPMERKQRRAFCAAMASTIRGSLPQRQRLSPAKAAQPAAARRAARAALGEEFQRFGVRPMAQAVKVMPATAVAAAGPVAAAVRRSLPRKAVSYEYYWGGRVDHERFRQIRLVKVETDAKGAVLRTTVLHATRARSPKPT